VNARAPLLLLVTLAACDPAAPVAPADAAVDLPAEAAAPTCTEAAGPFAPLSTRCGHFVDAQGRTVILHGVNARVEGVFDVALDMGRVPLQDIPAFAIEDARAMRALGFNVLRLPVQWSGLEPTESGGFDAAYVDRIAAVVALCRQAGLLVLIDWHQDAYSKEIGEDGAPRWAIVPAPEQLLGGPLTDLAARRTSRQVLRAFETFFGDGPDGERLRMRFVRAAAHVAARFVGDPTVIGYETYNEPIASDAQVLRVNVETARAMRAADPGHLVVFEPNVTQRQFTNRSSIPAAPFPLAGAVYAPHVYPLSFVSTPAQLQAFTLESLEGATASTRTEATAWGTPLLITEWGYDPNGTRADDYYDIQQRLQERSMASAMVWLWKEDSQGSWGLYDRVGAQWTIRPAMRRRLARVRPEAIAGTPVSYGFDRATRRFAMTFTGRAAVTAPNVLYVPAAEDFAERYAVTCDGRAVTGTTRDSATGRVEVPCGGDGSHTVTLSAL
jgi:endoglycosylceramidase